MRHVLTAEEQLRGIRKAIVSPKLPEHLRKSLIKRRDELVRKLDAKQVREKKPRVGRKPPGLLDWLGF